MKPGKWIKYTITALCGILLLTGITAVSLYLSADMKEPVFIPDDYPSYILEHTDSLRTYGPNQLRLSSSGLWELTLYGNAAHRGIATGQLAGDLLHYQEKVFVDQIKQFIPSDSYLKFLRFLLIIFNRNLGSYIPEEFRQEIYGISLHCTHEYDAIGTPYQRQLNYHAAHDIGHTMQDYMLIGCSSFGVWGDHSEDSTLLIGRNFDFYVGDDFARNKIVSFYHPEEGYRFASVGWAGMTGVLSGMNEKGLTVTINAAKSTVPTSAAMPISLLAREILQYASTIEEAYRIAQERETFVSESLLIGSAIDGVAAIIEKSPYQTSLFESKTDRIICTNHYQSTEFAEDKRNRENIETSDSPYRYNRLKELLSQKSPVDPDKAASILRDRLGHHDKEIGLTNEKSLNQFIAHHSVIFQPEKRLMWVSTEPWQLGEYICYDLNKAFSTDGHGYQCHQPDLTIPVDSFLISPIYENLIVYRQLVTVIRKAIQNKQPGLEDQVQACIESNPEFYYAWQLAGDYYQAIGKKEEAILCWKIALTKEIPHQKDRLALEKRIT